MAGLWGRIIPGNDRCSAHLLKAAMYLTVRGVFTDAQVLAALNAKMTAPLGAEAQSDLLAIKSAINAAGTLQAKLDLFERFDALNTAAECGALSSEATYRSQLGI